VVVFIPFTLIRTGLSSKVNHNIWYKGNNNKYLRKLYVARCAFQPKQRYRTIRQDYQKRHNFNINNYIPLYVVV